MTQEDVQILYLSQLSLARSWNGLVRRKRRPNESRAAHLARIRARDAVLYTLKFHIAVEDAKSHLDLISAKFGD